MRILYAARALRDRGARRVCAGTIGSAVSSTRLLAASKNSHGANPWRAPCPL